MREGVPSYINRLALGGTSLLVKPLKIANMKRGKKFLKSQKDK